MLHKVVADGSRIVGDHEFFEGRERTLTVAIYEHMVSASRAEVVGSEFYLRIAVNCSMAVMLPYSALNGPILEKSAFAARQPCNYLLSVS